MSPSTMNRNSHDIRRGSSPSSRRIHRNCRVTVRSLHRLHTHRAARGEANSIRHNTISITLYRSTARTPRSPSSPSPHPHRHLPTAGAPWQRHPSRRHSTVDPSSSSPLLSVCRRGSARAVGRGIGRWRTEKSWHPRWCVNMSSSALWRERFFRMS